ncbi:S-layer homology domain-containing protein [Paenibacillus frigoriresistens]|uniref:S-layer homology domain-containing protein n=1 Tax=Paenibacillus alginolyticus TaxID=59839 RepID=UPI001564F82C|nr:S-layer homology domain-containing protein [Paenibacillus frigoriresistens]NRF93628.1 S-layer homology domain-containing protein [Paenibacillus frigoriresistens]
MKKWGFPLFLVFLTLFSTPTSSFANSQLFVGFNDISSHWASKYIDYLVKNHIISEADGSDTNFEPDRSITRAEFASLLVKSLGLGNTNTVTGLTYFQDVSSNNWYYGYVNEAASLGVLKGYDNRTFKPNDGITREQTAFAIMHALQYSNIAAGIGSNLQDEILSVLRDADQIINAKNEVASIINARIMTGTEDNTFEPQAYLTRAQASVVIVRFMTLLKS